MKQLAGELLQASAPLLPIAQRAVQAAVRGSQPDNTTVTRHALPAPTSAAPAPAAPHPHHASRRDPRCQYDRLSCHHPPCFDDRHHSLIHNYYGHPRWRSAYWLFVFTFCCVRYPRGVNSRRDRGWCRSCASCRCRLVLVGKMHQAQGGKAAQRGRTFLFLPFSCPPLIPPPRLACIS